MSSEHDRSFLGHPRGLATLFFTEMWERWSFYGMRSLLTPFLAAAVAEGGLGFGDDNASSLYHIYLALIYLMSVPGGWLADRFLGQRRAVLWGGILIMAGHAVIAVHDTLAFFAGLMLVVLGTGLLKPNVSAVVGGLYAKDDARRDAAFSLFYMGINLGSFLGQLAAPFLAQHSSVRAFLERQGLDPHYGWQLGFGSAAVGMLFGILQYVRGSRYLGTAGAAPSRPPSTADKRMLAGGIGFLVVAVLCMVLLTRSGGLSVAVIDQYFGIFLTILTVVVFLRIFSGDWTAFERRRLRAILVYFTASCLFWSAFEQAGSTLNLFAVDRTRGELLGIEFAPGWYQNVNAIATIVLSPAFAVLWLKLGRRDPSHPIKFALGLLFVGLGFLAMERGAAEVAAGGPGTRVSGMFLIVTYVAHSIGEVCLSAVGLSVMTRLAPERVSGLMMGVWFLSISVGSYLGGRIAHAFHGFSQQGLFLTIAAIAGLGALAMWALRKPLQRLALDEG